MKPYCILLLCLLSLTAYAQKEVMVKTVVFTETLDKQAESNIPYVTDPAGKQNPVTTRINAAIQDRFMIDRFDPKQVSEFRWYDVEFTYQIREAVLHISFAGEYIGAYLNQVQDHLYFDLKDGRELEENILPFQAFFSMKGYYGFLQKYWLPDCSREFKVATTCAEGEPYCSCYDIEYAFEKQMLKLTLTDDCFPHVSRACSPVLDIQVPLDSVKPFLSAFGQEVLFKTTYPAMTRLERFLFYRKQYAQIPNYTYLMGSIGGKYPFSMAIQSPAGQSGTVSGYYYYDKQKINIPLTGRREAQKIIVIEQVDGKTTGTFELTWHNAFQQNGLAVGDQYLTGMWINPQSGKTTPVVFKESKSNK